MLKVHVYRLEILTGDSNSCSSEREVIVNLIDSAMDKECKVSWLISHSLKYLESRSIPVWQHESQTERDENGLPDHPIGDG